MKESAVRCTWISNLAENFFQWFAQVDTLTAEPSVLTKQYAASGSSWWNQRNHSKNSLRSFKFWFCFFFFFSIFSSRASENPLNPCSDYCNSPNFGNSILQSLFKAGFESQPSSPVTHHTGYKIRHQCIICTYPQVTDFCIIPPTICCLHPA